MYQLVLNFHDDDDDDDDDDDNDDDNNNNISTFFNIVSYLVFHPSVSCFLTVLSER